MTNHLPLNRKKILLFIIIFFLIIFISACVSHLKEAKSFYVQGQKLSRSYRQEKAVAAFKRALKEAELEAKKSPSAQAFMLKGMVELELELWEEAEESFLEAFSYGFEKGEVWAEEISLLGLAQSFQELGLEDSAFKRESSSALNLALLSRAKIRRIIAELIKKHIKKIDD